MSAHMSAIDVVAILTFAILVALFIHRAITSEEQYQNAMKTINGWGDRFKKMAELENDFRNLYEEVKAKGKKNVANFQSRFAELTRRSDELFGEKNLKKEEGLWIKKFTKNLFLRVKK